jgi:hypothetical protein
MHTGIISFCDRIGFNIKCSDAKDIILNELEYRYQIRILQKHWYALDEQQFQYVLKIPHAVSIRSNGNPYYLYFTRYEDVNQMMYIDKKVQPGYQKPRIILSKGQFADCIFNNTLVEGEMIKDNKKQWLFVINDIIIYQGKLLKEIPLFDRLKYAYELLEQFYQPDDFMDVCQFQVKRYVPATQPDIEKLLAFSEQLPYTSRGIYFYPHSMKYKPKLINFNDELIKSVYRKVKDNPDYIEKEKVEAVINIPVEKPIVTGLTYEENEKLLWLKKTELPDIYDLYEAENSLQKIGIASVPGLETSRMLRNVFKNMNVATAVAFKCKFDKTFQKWIPTTKI